MSTRTRTLPLLLLVVPMLIAGECGQKDTTDSAPPDCDPVANAGNDLEITLGSTATLDGCPESGFSVICDGTTYTYVWDFESVPVESSIDVSQLTDNNSAEACNTGFSPDQVGTYVLSLALSDGLDETSPDVVIVEVISGNQAPVASCGGDAVVEVGERVELDGSESYDPEGAALEFSWALSSWPADSTLDSEDIFNAGSATPTVIPDAPGMYLVSLVVSDGGQWSEPAYCTITASSENQPPIADAGTGGPLPPCTESEFELNAYGSYDPEGEGLEYLWAVLEVPAGSHADGSLDSGDTGPAGSPAFDDPSLATPTFTWDVVGTYTFQLNVFDGELWSAPDVVSVTIPDRSENTSPVANAGDDQSIEAEAECDLVSYGVHECEDCEGETIELDGTSSNDPDGDELNYYWSDATGELYIHTPYASYTQVTTAAAATTVGSTTTTTWEVNLDVSDCDYSDNDTVNVTFSCEGAY